MNRLIQLNKATPLFLMVLLLACFALPQKARAVSPAPDGGYPGGNTAEGFGSLLSLTTGTYNTAVGFLSLRSDATGAFNTAIGAGTLLANSADSNTATGAAALLSNTTGTSNTANGVDALGSSTTGNNNTALGFQAGLRQTTGSNNVYIGAGIAGDAGENNTCRIASIFEQTIDPTTATPVEIDVHNKLGTNASSRRFKYDIKPMDKDSETILALKPVTFHYKSDTTNTAQFGLIAEEVAAVSPTLVVRDKNGEIYTVRYDQVNAMLLNEFLKEHKTVQEQGAMIALQQKQIDALTTGLQKVSAQLELSRAAPQTVLNDQ